MSEFFDLTDQDKDGAITFEEYLKAALETIDENDLQDAPKIEEV